MSSLGLIVASNTQKKTGNSSSSVCMEYLTDYRVTLLKKEK